MQDEQAMNPGYGFSCIGAGDESRTVDDEHGVLVEPADLPWAMPEPREGIRRYHEF